MFRYGLSVLVLSITLVVAGAQTGTALKSGPQVGADVTECGPFHPLNVTGANAGKKACLFCSNGANPVAVIFARESSPMLAKLLKQLDQATVKNAKADMGSYAVFCSDKDGLDKQLTKLADEQKLEKLILTIENPAGPKGYSVSKDADVTVVLYYDFTVKANHAFRKGELNDAAIARIVADVAKIAK